jgi:hypothetical protein
MCSWSTGRQEDAHLHGTSLVPSNFSNSPMLYNRSERLKLFVSFCFRVTGSGAMGKRGMYLVFWVKGVEAPETDLFQCNRRRLYTLNESTCRAKRTIPVELCTWGNSQSRGVPLSHDECGSAEFTNQHRGSSGITRVLCG